MFEWIEKKEVQNIDHFYMNLPALSVDFLYMFDHLPEENLNNKPHVHIYTF